MQEEITCPHCKKQIKLRIHADPSPDYLSIEIENGDKTQ